jgi:hypothetical protein
LRDHPKLAIAELIAIAAFVLVVGQLHVSLWTTRLPRLRAGREVLRLGLHGSRRQAP